MADRRRGLLVASVGGHLAELVALRPRLGLDEVVWVTSPSEQAETLLAGEDVVLVPPVPPRALVAAARTVPRALAVVRRTRPDVVVSTGAAVALPFLAAARLQRVRAQYVESAARVAAPSLTGRLVARVPGVELYAQTDRMPAPWRCAGSVWDAFRAEPRAAAGDPLRVLVALGTMAFPFPRLVQAVAAALPADAEVVWQLGSSPAPERPGSTDRHLELVTSAEFDRLLREADVVVSHAGVGNALGALRAGRLPVLVPRRPEHHEHVDLHQVETAEALAARGLALHVEPEDLTARHLREAAARVVVAADPPPLPLLG